MEDFIDQAGARWVYVALKHCLVSGCIRPAIWFSGMDGYCVDHFDTIVRWPSEEAAQPTRPLLKLDQMEEGRRYQIIYRTDTQRTDHVAVMDFLHFEDRPTSYPECQAVFSARPIAGTQTMRPKWIRLVHEVPKTEPVRID